MEVRIGVVHYACVNTLPFLVSTYDEPAAFEHGTQVADGVSEMTTLDTEARVKSQPTTSENTPTSAVEQSKDTSALITEQQVLFSSAAALAPAPARRWNVAAAVREMFARPEKPRATRHYPQRFSYLESSALSREMDRL